MAGEAAVEEVGSGMGVVIPCVGVTPSSPGIETEHLLFAVVQQDNFSLFMGDAVVGAGIVFLHVVHGVLLLSVVSNVGIFDKSVIAMSNKNDYKGWITSPIKFINITENSKSLSETKYITLIHTVATFSEKTLSAGARIIDRVIKYASNEMQNWEFKQEIETFKSELIKEIDLESIDINLMIDTKTDKFLKSKGIKLKATEDVDN